jgi:putative endonuclease
MEWYVYIVRCRDEKLYVGIAKDVKKRVALHNKGLACRFTKYRKPVQLIFEEKQEDYRQARTREKEIKGFSREKKQQLISII